MENATLVNTAAPPTVADVAAKVVKVPAAAVDPPITMLSAVPPSKLAVVIVPRLQLPEVWRRCKS